MTTSNQVRARCPRCGGSPGDQQLRVRLVADEKMHGIPLVATVTTARIAEGLIENVCRACARGVAWRRVLAGVVETGVGLGLTLLGVRLGGFGLLIPFVVAGLVARGMLYSWSDRVLWGAALARRLAVKGAQFPAHYGHVAWRAFLLIIAALVVLARLDP